MYRLVNNYPFVIRIEDEAYIPMDESNADYRAFLEWLNEGNVPENYEFPVVKIVPKLITRRQCAIELRERGMITAQEALAMTKYGDVPGMIAAIISQMPEEQRIIIETDFAADSYLRSNPLLVSMMQATGATDNDIDDFFIAAAAR